MSIMSEEKVDLGVLEDLQFYMELGLEPGGFTTSLLLGDYEEAYRRAHPLLKKEVNGSDDIVFNMLRYVELYVPHVCRGSREKIQAWIQHEGLKGAPDMARVEYLLSKVEPPLR